MAAKEVELPGKGLSICFDTTQSERGKLEDNYTMFKQIVEKQGYSIVSNIEFPITFSQLIHYNIVVFACPDRSKIREFEISEVVKYVKCGGGVLIMASSGGDKGRMTNLNDLCSKFGINFNNDQVFDDQHNYGMRNLAISTKFEEHPITQALELVIIPSACSLSLSAKARAVISSDEDADPPNTPVIAISEYGLGRVVILGSWETFRDSIRAGIQVIQHRILLENMMKWMVKDKPLSQILFALSLLKLKEKKEAKSAAPLVPSSLPSTQGLVSPEALLDQILSNLQQVKSVATNLEDINNHLVEVAVEIKKLNENLEFAKEMRNDLLNIQQSLANSTIETKIETLDKEVKSDLQTIQKTLASSTLDAKIEKLDKEVKSDLQTIQKTLASSTLDIKIEKLDKEVKKDLQTIQKTLASSTLEAKIENLDKDFSDFRKKIQEDLANILKHLETPKE